MLINLDLAGAEWVVVAYLCRDEAMLDVVKSKKSPHVVTANRMFNVSEELILQEEALNKKASDPEVISANRQSLGLLDSTLPRTMSIRSAGKRNNHAGNYNIGYREFALHNEIPENEAKRQIRLYTQAYPGLPKWWKWTETKLRKDRVLENCFGRKVYFMGMMNDDTFKKGYAFVPQSTVADDCLTGMRLALEDESKIAMRADLLAQVHDSLLYQYPIDNFLDIAAFAVKVGRDYMRPILRYHGEEFQLDTDLKVGFNWTEMKELKLSDDVDAVAEQIREAADKLASAKRKAV